MARIEVRLFGRFALSRGGCAVDSIGATKLREILCYLLLHHDRPHPRERLASLLWPDTTTERSRKYLRQALWQLQAALRGGDRDTGADWLRIETDWIRLDVDGEVDVDVLRFQAAVTAAATAAGDGPLPAEVAASLEAAVETYRGPLLENCYQDWCLRERERLHDLLLDALDLLAAHHEAGRRYAPAQQWTMRLLRDDPAREGAHQRLMRIHYLAGNRTRALRQFDECVSALDDELGVEPSAATTALRDRIRAGEPVSPAVDAGAPDLDHILRHLRDLEHELAGVQGHVRQRIAEVERVRAGMAVPSAPARRPLRRAAPLPRTAAQR
ncbi:MAG: BTAD domain-containing putative transcriptional regulator [bacterium]